MEGLVPLAGGYLGCFDLHLTLGPRGEGFSWECLSQVLKLSELSFP